MKNPFDKFNETIKNLEKAMNKFGVDSEEFRKAFDSYETPVYDTVEAKIDVKSKHEIQNLELNKKLRREAIVEMAKKAEYNRVWDKIVSDEANVIYPGTSFINKTPIYYFK